MPPLPLRSAGREGSAELMLAGSGFATESERDEGDQHLAQPRKRRKQDARGPGVTVSDGKTKSSFGVDAVWWGWPPPVCPHHLDTGTSCFLVPHPIPGTRP